MKKILCSLLVIYFVGCMPYNFKHAIDIKIISFSNDLSKGKSMGPMSGQDCSYVYEGYTIGDKPNMGKALENAMSQAGFFAENFGAKLLGGEKKEVLRYMTNVKAEYEELDAFIFKRICLVVKGDGYQ
jgi:hypothetical protein